MQSAPLPVNEDARLQELRQYDVLDTAAEDDIDDLTLLAARLCHAPIALVSLVDDTRLWFKSRIGLAATETSRTIAFCAHAILQPDVLVVPDALADDRFADNPLVTGDPGIRFYAGAPLITSNGYPLGTICVLDRVARQCDSDQQDILRALSRQVVRRLEQRRHAKELQRMTIARMRAEAQVRQSEELLTSVLDNLPLTVFVKEARELRHVHFNKACEELLGISRQDMLGRNNEDLFPPEIATRLSADDQAVLAGGRLMEIPEETIQTTRGPRIVRTRKMPLCDADGAPQYLLGLTEDITERKWAEDSLQRTSAQLRAVIDSSPMAIAIVDTEGILRLWNPAATRTFGWTAEEVVGGPNPIVPEDRQEEYRRLLRQGLQNEPAVKQEVVRQRKDGTMIEVALSTAPVQGADGRVYGLMGILEDITDRKRMERALHESRAELERQVRTRTAELSSANLFLKEEIGARKAIEGQLRLTQYAVDHAADQIFVIGPDGYFLDVNESACLRLGFTKQELLTRSVMDIEPGCSLNAWRDFWAAFKEAKQIRLETLYRSKTGEIYPVEVTANYLLHDGQAFNYAIVRDITERKKAEAALRASELRYRDLAHFQQAVMHNIAEGLYVLDAQGRIAYTNPAAESLLGWSGEDLVGRSMHETAHYQHADGTMFPVEECPIYQMLHAGSSSKEHEDLFIRKDGTFFNAIVSCAPLMTDGQADGLVLLCRDITARKRADELLRKAGAERVRISQDLHDGILQSLYAVGLGLEACKPLLVSDPRQTAAMFDRAVIQLNRVMSEVRQFITGLEGDPLSGQELEFALRDLVTSLSHALRRRVRLSVDAKAAQAVSHPQALHVMYVAKEAISNAVSHGRAKDVTVTLKLLKHGVRLAIRDSGAGFNPNRVGGGGHGLANMAARARKLGGRFSVVSKPKAGTRIVFDFPPGNATHITKAADA